MTDQLAPRYARYGLMASMTLAAFDDLEERAGEETRVVPLGDDAERIERLRDMLAASFVGGVPPEQQKDAVFALSGHRRSPSDVEDSLIVASVLPNSWSLENFVPRAVRVLDTIKSEGIAPLKVTGAPDGEFFYGALRDFLDRLAHSSQSVRASSRRSARHRYSLG
jgi:hypothetical protein